MKKQSVELGEKSEFGYLKLHGNESSYFILMNHVPLV